MADTCEDSSSEGSDSILSDNFTRHTRVNSHSEISLCKGTPQLHMWKVRVKRMVLWEGHLMEGLDWNDGKRQAENGIAWQKNRTLAAIFYRICFDADVTGNCNFREKGVSKNKTTCENAVARI